MSITGDRIEVDNKETNSSFSIDVETLKEIVNLYMQREKGSDDIDYLYEHGGYEWLEKGLVTNLEKGFDLSTKEERSQFYGTNQKKEVKKRTFLQLCWRALDDFILKILIVGGILSTVIHMIIDEDKRHIAWVEGFAILVAVLLVVLTTALNDLKKEREFQKLNDEAEATKRLSIIRNGEALDHMRIMDVLVGDVINLSAGMEIAGDGILIEGYTLSIDEASMTGETKPMKKDSLQNCIERKHKLEEQGVERIGHNDIPSVVLMAGTKVLSGSGKMLIINVGKNSAIGKIQEIMTSGEEELTPMQLKLEKMARTIGYFALIVASTLFIILMIRFIIDGSREDWEDDTMEYVTEVLEFIILTITIIVVSLPEGLPLAVTLSLALSIGKMMKDNNLVRKLHACETMGSANIICSDKTGTLTRNEMYLTHLWNMQEIVVFDAVADTAVPYDLFVHSDALEIFQMTIVLNSTDDPKKKGGNPTEVAILRYFDQLNFDINDYRHKFTKFFQASFSSDRKRMSTIIKVNENKGYVFIKGASEYIMNISDKMLDLKENKVIEKDEELESHLVSGIERMARRALRTVGLAYKEVDLNTIDIHHPDEKGIFDWEKDGFTMLGVCGIKDTIRAEVPDSIKKCNNAGIDVKMVTGDNKITARAIAEEVYIINRRNAKTALVLEGPEFLRQIGGIVCANCRDKEQCDCVANEKDLDEPENKGKKIRKDTIKNQDEFDKIWKDLCVLARSRPEDKYALVIGLKERDNVVAVTGDGTNDAPALSKANVGFAMNIAGTEVAKQAADILVMDDNFASIVQAVKWGRNIFDSIRKFLQLQLTANLVAVTTTFFTAAITYQPLLTAVQLLWVNLVINTLAALALATEPPAEELLQRKPTGKKEAVISPLMMKHILGQAVYQITVLFILFFLGHHFLFDIIRDSQNQPGSDVLIVSGRRALGYDIDDFDGQYPVHFTYNFNIFICLQLFNFINARVIDDSLNPFRHILQSTQFILIWTLIIVLQIIFLTFLGPAIQVVQWGLDPISWVFCLALGSTTLLVGFILKFIPLERILPGGGSEEITIAELEKFSSLSFRRSHSPRYYRQQAGMLKSVTRREGAS